MCNYQLWIPHIHLEKDNSLNHSALCYPKNRLFGIYKTKNVSAD